MNFANVKNENQKVSKENQNTCGFRHAGKYRFFSVCCCSLIFFGMLAIAGEHGYKVFFKIEVENLCIFFPKRYWIILGLDKKISNLYVYNFIFDKDSDLGLWLQPTDFVCFPLTQVLVNNLLTKYLFFFKRLILFISFSTVPPKFIKVPQSQVIPTAQTVRFDCEVEGVPEVSTHWLRNGEQLYINGRIKLKTGNTLVVSQTVTTDSGIYQCVASNSAGVNVSSARLVVNASSECANYLIII